MPCCLSMQPCQYCDTLTLYNFPQGLLPIISQDNMPTMTVCPYARTWNSGDCRYLELKGCKMCWDYRQMAVHT